MRSVLEILERLHVLLAVRYCYDISRCEDAAERTGERARLLSWVEARGLFTSMDAEELEILNENPESLAGDLAINASWAIEGAYLCAWALSLHRALEYDESIEDICELAAASGFLGEADARPVLRNEERTAGVSTAAQDLSVAVSGLRFGTQAPRPRGYSQTHAGHRAVRARASSHQQRPVCVR